MSSRYRVSYQLTTHRRDLLIEWIKGLLAVPFVLHTTRPSVDVEHNTRASDTASELRQRYAEILRDVENLVNDHITLQKDNLHHRSKLKLLVPSIGSFFTPLRLHEAFLYQDEVRKISARRFVPPSFNDLRLTLNTAQVLSLIENAEPLALTTFDGDVTLYADGQCLLPDNPVISRLIHILSKGIKVGIVTAAGYTEASKYYERLGGLLEAMKAAALQGLIKDPGLLVMGGEASYLFEFDLNQEHLLSPVPRDNWVLPEMTLWTDQDVAEILDTAEKALEASIAELNMDAIILRKERAVGIIQDPKPGSRKMHREQLEETVLTCQHLVEMCPAAQRVPFCAFNGGSDVFVDIGDKSWGVRVCQKYLGGIPASRSLHVGDQFLQLGANDFKARLACTTAWIASPAETVELLDEISVLMDKKDGL